MVIKLQCDHVVLFKIYLYGWQRYLLTCHRQWSLIGTIIWWVFLDVTKKTLLTINGY